jgi:hypothetical protein
MVIVESMTTPNCNCNITLNIILASQKFLLIVWAGRDAANAAGHFPAMLINIQDLGPDQILTLSGIAIQLLYCLQVSSSC